MATELLPHHHDQFAARHQGVRHVLETGKLPRLDDEARARLFGWDREDLADRLVQGFSCFVIGAVGSIIVGSAVRLVWLFAL